MYRTCPPCSKRRRRRRRIIYSGSVSGPGGGFRDMVASRASRSRESMTSLSPTGVRRAQRVERTTVAMQQRRASEILSPIYARRPRSALSFDIRLDVSDGKKRAQSNQTTRHSTCLSSISSAFACLRKLTRRKVAVNLSSVPAKSTIIEKQI